MSQDSNTTDGTDPKPHLQIRKPDGSPAEPESPPPAIASGSPGVLPRLLFSPNKKVVEAAPVQPAVERPVTGPAQPPLTNDGHDSQLKRPPPGTRLISLIEPATPSVMPAPLNPVRGATAAPFAAPKKARFRTQVPLWIVVFILVLIVGGESYYILMQDEDQGAESTHRPPILIASGPAIKPVDVAANGVAPTPVYGFLQNLNPEIAAGTDPRLFINSQIFHLGDVVSPEFGLKWVRINDQTRELEFADKRGQHYIKKF